MPRPLLSDEYASVGGTLKLKGGAGVEKKKKKKKKSQASQNEMGQRLERQFLATAAVSGGSSSSAFGHGDEEEQLPKITMAKTKGRGGEGGEAEKKIVNDCLRQELVREGEDEKLKDDGLLNELKTETERRFAEARRKKLEGLVKKAKERPELLKTHKQRIEELNSHLSKMSEHHDMPKIGPG